MAGQIRKTQRPSQDHINMMLQKSKQVQIKQMEVLEMVGDIASPDFARINLETGKQKRKRQSKRKIKAKNPRKN